MSSHPYNQQGGPPASFPSYTQPRLQQPHHLQQQHHSHFSSAGPFDYSHPSAASSSSSGAAAIPPPYYTQQQQQQHASDYYYQQQPHLVQHHQQQQQGGRGGTSSSTYGPPPPSVDMRREMSTATSVQDNEYEVDLKPKLTSGAPPLPSASAPTRAPSTRKKTQREALVDFDSDGDRPSTGKGTKGGGSGKVAVSGPSEFVLKLYAMLEDTNDQSIVGWNSKGDSFIVKDMNGFGTSILPQTFRHSNFASFVRQLNKYDFHKVKGEEGKKFGDNVWEFRHPQFKRGSSATLDQVKRKAVPPKKLAPPTTNTPLTSSTNLVKQQQYDDSSPQIDSPVTPLDSNPEVQMLSTAQQLAQQGQTVTIDAAALQTLKNQVNILQQSYTVLQQSQTTMYNHVQTLHVKYQKMISDLVTLTRTSSTQEGLIGDVVTYLVKQESEGSNVLTPNSNGSGHTISHPLARLQAQVQASAAANNRELVSIESPGSSRSAHSQNGTRLPRPSNGKGKERELSLQGWDGPTPVLPLRPIPQPISFQNPSPFTAPPGTTSSQHHSLPSGIGPSPYTPLPTPTTSSIRPPTLPESYTDPLPLIDPLDPVSEPNGNYSQLASGADFFNGPGGVLYQQQVRSVMHEQAYFGEGVDQDGLRVFTVGHLRPRGIDDGLEEEEGGPLSSYPLEHQQQNEGWADVQPHVSDLSYQDASMPTRPATAGSSYPHPNDPTLSSVSNYGSHPSTGNNYAPQASSSNLQSFNLLSNGPTPSTSSSLPMSNGAPYTSASASSLKAPSRKNSTAARPPGTLRVRRSTYVPGWAVPPRVLIVEDDAVVRKMSTKLLEVAGCTIDVAVDGVEAVNQMNLSRYDLVLMDIVMPNLDGVSATNLIRQFDAMTPIISMTSNSAPEDLRSYMSSGMSGHLSKPFSRDGLIGMVEKHLLHMTTAQSFNHVPRTPGVPPLSDAHIDDALSQGLVELQNGGEDLSNPLGGMGLPDDQYMAMLQSLLSSSNGPNDGMQSTLFAGSFSSASGMGMGTLGLGLKRNLDDDDDLDDDGGLIGDVKRQRFESLDEN